MRVCVGVCVSGCAPGNSGAIIAADGGGRRGGEMEEREGAATGTLREG